MWFKLINEKSSFSEVFASNLWLMKIAACILVFFVPANFVAAQNSVEINWFDYDDVDKAESLKSRLRSAKTPAEVSVIIDSIQVKGETLEEFGTQVSLNSVLKYEDCVATAIVYGLEELHCYNDFSQNIVLGLNRSQYWVVRGAIVACATNKCSKKEKDVLKQYWDYPRFKLIRGSVSKTVETLSASKNMLCGLSEVSCHNSKHAYRIDGIIFTESAVLSYFLEQNIDAWFGNDLDPLLCEVIQFREKYWAETKQNYVNFKAKFPDTSLKKMCLKR